MEMKLTIRRVPTVVSNYQEDSTAADKPRGGCGRNCLGDCCLPDSKLPLYAFKANPAQLPSQGEDARSKSLVNLLLTEWEDRMARGLFRYDVTACETKVIPDNLGFVTQLNEGRHLKKRPSEFCVDRVLQPFDPAKFNFTKVGQEEVLFQFENGAVDDSYFLESAPITVADRAPNVVAINVSPIEYGHVLLIPHVLDRLPQRIDTESFLLALQMAAEAASPYFRLGYNSLGAFATINHLHFQLHVMTKGLIRLGMRLAKWNLPMKFVDFILVTLAYIQFGDLSKHGIVRPNMGPLLLKAKTDRSAVIDVGTTELIRRNVIKVLGPISRIRGNNVEFEDGKNGYFDSLVFATGYKSTANMWLENGESLLNENGMPKREFPNHWKGENGLYCVGLAMRGLAGISHDAKNVAADIKSIIDSTTSI